MATKNRLIKTDTLIFKPRTLDGLSDKDRKTTVSTLACLLMEAAGLVAEEINDEQH